MYVYVYIYTYYAAYIHSIGYKDEDIMGYLTKWYFGVSEMLRWEVCSKPLFPDD